MHGLKARAVGVLLAALLAPGLGALTVLHMTLGDLCENGHRIYRGTVIGSIESTRVIGGAEIPVTTYRIRVDEAFKGEFVGTKGAAVVDLPTLGKSAPAEAGGAVRAVLLPEVPRLEIGATYVLFTTRAARTGLATTVGLGQGCFRVLGEGEKEIAINAFENAGLFTGTSLEGAIAQGPVPYATLAGAIRATLRTQQAGP